MTTTPLAGRTIVLGVCGGIAAYKAVELTRLLIQAGAVVLPVLTQNAQQFVGIKTFDALASEPTRTDLYNAPEQNPHLDLARRADLVIVAPATARVLADLAHGASRDLLTAVLLATEAPIFVAPAMHTEMWNNPATQQNIEMITARGVNVVGPEHGELAGGDEGIGRMSEPQQIVKQAISVLDSPWKGINVVVTAGGTREPIDPVRFIGNRSSGKMGHALAASAASRGADVTLITTTPADHVHARVISVETAQEMKDALQAEFDGCDVLFMAAAVADFRPKEAQKQKRKKELGPPDVVLEPTPDILEVLTKAHRPDQLVVGFAAETENLLANAEAKLRAKNLDLIIANDVMGEQHVFDSDENRVSLLGISGVEAELQRAPKRVIAERILDHLEPRLQGVNK